MKKRTKEPVQLTVLAANKIDTILNPDLCWELITKQPIDLHENGDLSYSECQYFLVETDTYFDIIENKNGGVLAIEVSKTVRHL